MKLENCDCCFNDEIYVVCPECKRCYCSNCLSDYDDMGVEIETDKSGLKFGKSSCDGCKYGCEKCRLWLKCEDCEFSDFFGNYSEREYLQIQNLIH
jgi:hypothetical protein